MTVSRKSLLKTYKSFIRSVLDYANDVCDKGLNKSLKRKLGCHLQCSIMQVWLSLTL